jgi:arsenical pump membrane protein
MILWTAGVTLTVLAAALVPDAAVRAATATLGPFGTLAAIILGSVLADRLGAFAVLERALIPDRRAGIASAAAILGFTALLSALINLDVAVVIGMPVALRFSLRHPAGRGVAPDRLALSVAVTANATSFLLPTSNVTNLLLLGRVHLRAASYISESWLPWLLVTGVTVGALAVWSVAPARSVSRRPVTARPATSHATSHATSDATSQLSAGMLADLLPLFLIAAGIRALLGSALALHGSVVSQLAHASAIASVAGNLPAAATLLPGGTTALWPAVLATTIGPNLLITGSVATLISRRIATGAGVRFSAWRFSVIGLILVPVQFALAMLGLHYV